MPDPGGGSLTIFVDGTPRSTVQVPPGGTVEWTDEQGLSWYGEHVIIVIYSATATHTGSSAQVFVKVLDDRTDVTVSLTSSPNPAMRGEPIAFSVAVSPNPHGGEVQLRYGGSPFETGPLGVDGKATLYESFVSSAKFGVVACFVGNETHKAACSDPIDQVVQGIGSTTTLTIEPSTVYPDESVRIVVSVSPAPETDATVWVGRTPSDKRVPIGVSGLTGYGDVFLTPRLVDDNFVLGFPYDLRAFFPGTAKLEPSTSDVVHFIVRTDDPTLVTDVDIGPARVGDPITFSASVQPLPIVESAGVHFFVSGPASSGFGDHVGVELGLDGEGSTIVDTDGWPAGDYWYEATCCGDPRLTVTKQRGYFTLADEVAPTGMVSVEGGAGTVGRTTVTLDVPASDGAGSGVKVVALSNDGTNWTTRTYAVRQSWTLTSANGTKTVQAKWRDQAGNWSAVRSDTVVLDTVAPTATAPTRSFVTGSAISAGKVPVRLAWSGSDATSGIARYELAQSTDGGSWSTVATNLTKASSDRSLAPGHTYRFRVRAVDKAGNVGAWATGSTFTLSRYSEGSSRIRYSGTWRTASGSAYWGGGAKYASAAGAKATFTSTGRSFAWISRKGPTRGKAQIYVNGTRVATVDLYAASYQNQRVVWSTSWSTATSRTITVRVVGTSGRPRIDMDAIVTGS